MSVVARFDVQYTRYLDPTGEPLSTLPECARDPDRLRRLYGAMVLTRVFDKRAMTLQRTGQLGTYASSLGQEASMIGIGAAMHSDDVLLPTYREHGIYLYRGVSMIELLLYWGGDERGMDFATVPKDFPVCIPIATQLAHAAGVAYAMKLRGQGRAAVPVCGDGATSKGDFYEALNGAGVLGLPCVFAVVNNQWAISLPRSAQTRAATLAQKAIAAGIPGEQVDGDDVIAVLDRFSAALARARSGGGPTLIETVTYRRGDHTTADDSSRYRPAGELDRHLPLDPIERLRAFMTGCGEWDAQREADLQAAAGEQVEAAVNDYLATPPRGPETMFDCLYESLPEAYREQVADSIARRKRRG